jgi:glycosyltransferase involved in cell wall biosynthesis
MNSPSLKVAHITTVDLSLRYLLLNQLGWLQQHGYEVVAISTPGPDVPSIEAAGIRHLAVPMTRQFTPFRDMVALGRLVQLMRRERFIVVHTHTPKPGLLGQLAARMAGVPVVVNTLHGFYFHEHMPAHWRHFYVTMERVAARCSSVILSQNSEDIGTAIREKICHPNQIKHLGNGIDIERFDRERLDPHVLAALRRELGFVEGNQIVGFVGRLVAEKGILELLQAAQIVHRQLPTVRFLIIGPIEPDKADSLTPEVAAEYGVEAICTFTGLRQDMPELYALMDCFVLPSHREGFPRAPMEASAMGVPCVVTNIRGCREAVEEGRNGHLVPLKDGEAVARSILELLTDREKAARMGVEGRRMAEDRFDERLVFRRVAHEYSRLLAEKGVLAPQAHLREAKFERAT